jgi:hypothetical protein
MKTNLKIGDTVRHVDPEVKPAGWRGELMSITPGKAYSGPKAGPYRVAPKPMLTYLVRLPDGSVMRFAHVEGESNPLTVADA